MAEDMSKTLMGLGISSEYVHRKSGETVEVIAFNNPSNGERTDDDWVSFIDKDGVEHIKEHLNIQFDFKATSGISQMFEKLLNPPAVSKFELPDIWESRRFDMTKDLIVKVGLSVDDAIELADNVISKLKPNVVSVE